MIALRYVSLTTTAELFDVDRSEVLGWVERGLCPKPHFIVGDVARFAMVDLQTWAQAGFPEFDPPSYREMLDFRLAFARDLGCEFGDHMPDDPAWYEDWPDDPVNVVHFDYGTAPTATAAPPKPDTRRRFRR